MIPESVTSADNNTAAAIAAGAELAKAPVIQEIQGQPVAYVPEGLTLENYSNYLPKPLRLKQTVALHTPAAFVGYVRLFADAAQSVVFSMAKVARFHAVLDYHKAPDAPTWGEHHAFLQLTHTPAWAEWAGSNKKPMNQSDFGQFLEDHPTDIAVPDAGVLVEMARNFEAKKNVTFQSSLRARDGATSFTFNEDVQGTSKQGQLQIPSEIVLVLAPFEGSKKHEIKARIRYRIGEGGKLSLWYDLIRVQEVLDETFQEIATQINGELAGAVRAVIAGNI